MNHDGTKPAPPRGIFAASLALLVGAVIGAVMAVNHTTTLYLILGIVICAGCALLSALFAYAGIKGKRANRE